jgi:hypothetical protein
MPGQGIAPAPRRIAAGPRAPCGRGRRRFQASFRRALFRAFWRLGFRQSSFRHIAQISRRTAPYAWARSPVCMACYGPLHLSDPGKAIRSTDTSSSPCPLRGRYSSCATWRSRGNRTRPSGHDPSARLTPGFAFQGAPASRAARPYRPHPARRHKPPPRRGSGQTRRHPHQPGFSRDATIPQMKWLTRRSGG